MKEVSWKTEGNIKMDIWQYTENAEIEVKWLRVGANGEFCIESNRFIRKADFLNSCLGNTLYCGVM